MKESSLAGRVVRACVNSVEPRPERAQARRDCGLYRCELGPAVVTAADAGLVGHEHDRNVAPVRCRDNLGGARDNRDIVYLAEVTGLLDDHAVPIEEQGGPATWSANPDIAPDSFRIYWARFSCGGGRITPGHSPSG